MDERLFFPATHRNRDYIAEVLSKELPANGFVLEIASGSGEHGVIFQEKFPNIYWQTSDPNPFYRRSITAWIDHKGLSKKMPKPIDLAVEKKPWPLTREFRSSVNAIVCINMIHISEWSCTESLFEEAGNILKKDGLLMLYGPFNINGKSISESNLQFDKSLKSQNEEWGIRDLNDINEIGINHGLENYKVIHMPSYNFSIMFKKK
tara:strand:- start:838 stop:1455 length:618 start_codon:yes stop_codon:yes gene_type:complete